MSARLLVRARWYAGIVLALTVVAAGLGTARLPCPDAASDCDLGGLVAIAYAAPAAALGVAVCLAAEGVRAVRLALGRRRRR